MRVCHYDKLRRVHHSFLTRYIEWRKNNRTDHPVDHLDTIMKTGSERIEAIMHAWSSHIARVRINRVRLPILLVVS